MVMDSRNNEKKIAIVGAGISGLECAKILINNGFNVTVFDKQSEVLMRTEFADAIQSLSQMHSNSYSLPFAQLPMSFDFLSTTFETNFFIKYSSLISIDTQYLGNVFNRYKY